MRNRINIFIIITLLLSSLIGMTGCVDEEYNSHSALSNYSLVLSLPVEEVKDIHTRTAESSISDIFAVIIRNGFARYESVQSFSVSGANIRATLKTLNPKVGEKLYVFCNTGLSSVIADNEEQLLKQVTYTNTVYGRFTMYGTIEINAPNENVMLKRSLAKSTLTTPTDLTVTSWKICNVPEQGYVSGGYPTDANLEDITYGGDEVAYFIPRTDNNTTTNACTFLLVEIEQKGWYRLDFYDGGNLNINDRFVPLNLEKNTYYRFVIQSLSGNGYSTEEEAAANTGSNILYNMTVSNEKAGSSNGQYTLAVSTEEIWLYPADISHNQTALTVSAIIPANSINDITTYQVSLKNHNDQLKIIDGDTPVTTLDLYKNTLLTTENSLRDITLLLEGMNFGDAYLEIQLGNITKQVPIKIQSANCYMFDFSVQSTLNIPVLQANADGIERIKAEDNVIPQILWSDRPDISLIPTYDKDKHIIQVTSNGTSSIGNAVIAAVVNNEIRWSWHIWMLDNTYIHLGSKGVFEFNSNKINSYNNYDFMAMNLGATSDDLSNLACRGLLYQWGRKDPFPVSVDNAPNEPYLYVGSKKYKMTEAHPTWGDNIALITPSNVDGTNLEHSIRFPNKFIEGMSYVIPSTGLGDLDWYTNNPDKRNNYLWISREGDKTPYNPCPIGWIVPNGKIAGPWVGLWPTDGTSVPSKGVSWNSAGGYPFTNHRNPDGQFAGQPNFGFYWWGNGDDRAVHLTTFNGSQVIYAAFCARGQGAFVRCVKE